MTPLTRGGEKLRESATIGQNILMKKVLIQSNHVEEFLGLLIRRGVWPFCIDCLALFILRTKSCMQHSYLSVQMSWMVGMSLTWKGSSRAWER